jgi:hypothetical protein
MEIVPPVWRRFRVPANFTLRRLHGVLQGVMGWPDSPLHEFRVGEELFGMPSGDSETLKDSRWVTLQDLLALKTKTFSYDYDLGERWSHLLRIEGVSDGDQTNQRPLCLAGEGACPPADCGGPDGYVEILEARREEGHPGTAAPFDPLGLRLDPESFDLDGVNAILAALRF